MGLLLLWQKSEHEHRARGLLRANNHRRRMECAIYGEEGCLVICMAQYILAEGPLFFVVIAIPRNMGLFDVASTNARGLTVMKCIQA